MFLAALVACVPIFLANDKNPLFILSSISNGWLLWSVNHTSIAWNSELNIFKKTWFFWRNLWETINGIFEKDIYKTPESCWKSLLTMLLWTTTASVISRCVTFSPILFSVIYFQCFIVIL